MMKPSNYTALIFCCVVISSEVCADPPAIISVDHPDDLRIIDQTDNSERGRFRVSVFSNPQKCSDGSLKFALRIDLENSNEVIRFGNKVIENSNNGKVFFVTVPKSEMDNRVFYKEIQIEANDTKLKLDKIRLKIEPKVKISSDRKRVDFGKILHNGVRLISENSPSVVIRYSILKDAVCEVFSKNNFHLKNKDHYIPYSLNGLTENGEIRLMSDRDEYIANFKISEFGKKPSAGVYSDKITFSIKTRI